MIGLIMVEKLHKKHVTEEEAIKDIADGRHEWAVALKGLRYREDLTQKQLGVLIGMDQGNISSMERGKCPIGKNIAKKLSALFKVDYRLFL